jgi:hypothetical protein
MKRQGDILLIKVSELPPKLKKREDGTIVLGEATGHKHFLEKGDVYESEMPELLYLQTHEPTRIIHEDHNPIPISEPGIYEIRRKREYTNRDMTRLVVD